MSFSNLKRSRRNYEIRLLTTTQDSAASAFVDAVEVSVGSGIYECRRGRLLNIKKIVEILDRNFLVDRQIPHGVSVSANRKDSLDNRLCAQAEEDNAVVRIHIQVANNGGC